MAAETYVHPSHQEFGATTGKLRVVGFFDCVTHAEVMAAQGPLTPSAPWTAATTMTKSASAS